MIAANAERARAYRAWTDVTVRVPGAPGPIRIGDLDFAALLDDLSAVHQELRAVGHWPVARSLDT